MVPISGDPDGLRATADALVAQSRRIGALRRVLTALDAGSGWDSPAGRAFVERVRVALPVLDRVAQRYGAGGAALREYAGALEHAQAETTAAIRSHEESSRARDHLGELAVIAEQSGSPSEIGQAAGYRARMVAAGEAVFGAERRYRAARNLFDDADRRCAHTLQGLARDGLADSALYDAVTGAGDVAGRMVFELEPLARLPLPQLKGLQAVTGMAAGVQTASDVVVRIAYGDGDLDRTAIAGSVMASALGRGSSLLRSAAKIRGVNGYRARLWTGASAELRGASSQLRSAFRKPPTARPPRLPGLRGLDAHARVEALRRYAHARLVFEAEKRFLDDWTVAMANGPQAQRLLVGSHAAEGLAKDTQRALTVRERFAAKDEQTGR